MDPEVRIYFIPKFVRKGGRMPFLSEKRRILVMTPVRDQILIQNGFPMIARILFSCQRAAIVERYKHLIGLSRSIESP